MAEIERPKTATDARLEIFIVASVVQGIEMADLKGSGAFGAAESGRGVRS